MRNHDDRKQRLISHLENIKKGKPDIDSSCWKKILSICDWMFDKKSDIHIDFDNTRKDNKVVFYIDNIDNKFMIINPQVASPNLEFLEEFMPQIMTRFGKHGKWLYIKGKDVSSLTEEEIKEKLVIKAISKIIKKPLPYARSNNDLR